VGGWVGVGLDVGGQASAHAGGGGRGGAALRVRPSSVSFSVSHS